MQGLLAVSETKNTYQLWEEFRYFALRNTLTPFDYPSALVDQEHSFSTNTESAIKTLGVSWKPAGDYFMFKVSIPSIASYTKRDVLSVIARLLRPSWTDRPRHQQKQKIFLQKLWLRKIELGRMLAGGNRTTLAQFCVISKSPRRTQNRSIPSYRFL
ncbi:hypothetical protein TNCT_49811 [Trichonephila clavata]|uniref:Uncharacterized protein n=1 Tax=Trichonephila clavata TaxID=2740835 RepID=A0A8X6KLJ3_TRICU|nr:hypothetical protein TNCT_49811 [Trichonephila clavata]